MPKFDYNSGSIMGTKTSSAAQTGNNAGNSLVKIIRAQGSYTTKKK